MPKRENWLKYQSDSGEDGEEEASEDSWKDEDLGNAVVHVKGNTFILKAEIQGLSAWCWPWVRWIGLCVDARTRKPVEKITVSAFCSFWVPAAVCRLLFSLGWIWGVFVETNVIFLRMVGMFTIFFLYFFKGWSSGKFTGNHSVICLITFTQRKRYYSASLNFKSLFLSVKWLE